MAKRLTLSEQLIDARSANQLMADKLMDLEAQVATKDRLISLQEEELRQLRPIPAQLTETQTQLALEKSHKDYYYRESQEKQKELEDVHTVLDVMPGTLPRKAPDDQYRDYNVTLRLTVFLANHGKIAR